MSNKPIFNCEIGDARTVVIKEVGGYSVVRYVGGVYDTKTPAYDHNMAIDVALSWVRRTIEADREAETERLRQEENLIR